MNTQLQGTSELISELTSKWNFLKIQNYGPPHPQPLFYADGGNAIQVGHVSSLLRSGWFSLSSLALPFHVNVQLWDKSPCRMAQQANITRITPKQANSTGDHAQTGKHHQRTCSNRTDSLLPPFPSPCYLALTAIQKLLSEHLDIPVASMLGTQQPEKLCF